MTIQTTSDFKKAHPYRLTKECLSIYFDYRDGHLYAKAPRARISVGRKLGGYNNCGYIQLGFANKVRLAHRIIWIMHYGDIPDGHEIDHVNFVRDDNRIENLQLLSRAENIARSVGRKRKKYKKRAKKTVGAVV